MYDDLGYDEDPHLHCLESTQHSWVLDPSWIKAQQVVVHKSHMVTFTIPPNSVATPSPCILGIDPPFVPTTDLFCVHNRLPFCFVGLPPCFCE